MLRWNLSRTESRPLAWSADTPTEEPSATQTQPSSATEVRTWDSSSDPFRRVPSLPLSIHLAASIGDPDLKGTYFRGEYRPSTDGAEDEVACGKSFYMKTLSGNIASGLDPAQNPTYRSQPAAASGGKARNTAFPNAAMFSQTIIIAHSGVMPNWPRPPVQERSVGTSGDPTEAACLPGRVGRRIRHYVAQITRVASSAIARSCESEIRAFPPLVLRCSSGRPRVETLGQTDQS